MRNWKRPKEELQSVNEELATVNAELQAKVTDLSRVNNDMNNLLAGTGIATVFVDHRLCILRFTPAASTIINLIPGDVGRPVGHIASNLVGYTTLVKDVQTVLDTLEPKQTEVRTVAGNSYTLRVKPYRTLENAIEGAVISFSDITEHIRMEETLRAEVAELLRLAVVARDVHDAIAVQDLDGRILTWSPGAVRMYGWTESEALQMNARDRIPDGGSEDPMTMQPHLSEGKGLEPFRTRRITKEGKILDVSILATALTNEAGQLYAIATTERAIHAKQE
jgi:two-component system, chemotaxis family, CheB/CheR fusion protein